MPQMPSKPRKSIEEIAEDVGLYPPEAYQFVGQGLNYTVKKLKGHLKEPDANRHISGQELSEGLREFALMQWGLMARTVLLRWNIHRTDDFGKIVFALVSNDWLSKTDEDDESDFRNVFDFDTAFREGYRIECKS
jgi:uncharacterized repeat protein (TIGR04138 family)